jgi:predicted RNase H-like HicB family nuclease
MKTFKVRYELDATGWWVASVAGLAGCHTQGRTIEQAEERVRDALALFVADEVAATAQLKTEIELPPPARRALLAATRKRAKADAVAKDSQRAARAAARALSKTGLSLRDVGWLLGVSRQRAHQLVSLPR